MKGLLSAFAFLAAVTASFVSQAQNNFPTRAVRVVVFVRAGGGFVQWPGHHQTRRHESADQRDLLSNRLRVHCYLQQWVITCPRTHRACRTFGRIGTGFPPSRRFEPR